MGTIEKGILGGFSGKVGTVIGGTWKGIDYMRSKSSRRNFKPSQKQLEQQIKFGLAIRFVQSFSGLAERSFGDFAIRKTGINSAVSFTLRNAIIGSYPNFSIDYGQAQVSRGDLPNALAPAVSMAAGGLATWTWTDNTGVGIARPTDQVLLMAYCPALNQSIYITAGADRSVETESLNLSSFSGMDVHCWIGFMSENGANAASSLYNGMHRVL